MKIIVCAGKNTANITSVLEKRFRTGNLEFRSILDIATIKGIFQRGEYFDRAIVVDKSWTNDDTDMDESNVRERLADFVRVFNEKCADDTTIVFLSANKSQAKLAAEESIGIASRSKVIFKELPYHAKFISDLATLGLGEIPQEIVYSLFGSAKVQNNDSQYGGVLTPANEIPEDELLNTDIADEDGVEDSLTQYDDVPFEGNAEVEQLDESWATELLKRQSTKLSADHADELVANTEGHIGDNNEIDTGDIDELDFDNIDDIDASDLDSDEIDIDDLDIEDLDSDDLDIEDLDSDDLDSDEIGVEDLDSDEIGVEDLDSDDLDSDEIDIEDLDSDETGVEDLDSGDLDSDDLDSDDLDSDDLDSAGLGYDELDSDEVGIEDIDLDSEGIGQTDEDAGGVGVADIEEDTDKIGGDTDSTGDIDEKNLGVISEAVADILGDRKSNIDNNLREATEVDSSMFVTNSEGYADGQEASEQLDGLKKSGKLLGKQRSSKSAAAEVKKLFLANTGRATTIVVTGASGSGKTTNAFRIAKALNRLDYSVLIIDLDTLNRGQALISKKSFEAVHTPDTASMGIKLAISSGVNIGKNVGIISPGLYVLSAGLAADRVKPEDLGDKTKLNRFFNSIRTYYDFVIVDLDLDTAVNYAEDILFSAEHIVLTMRLSNWSVAKTMLEMANIENEEVQSLIFSRANILITSTDNTSQIMGKKLRNIRHVLKIMDEEIKELIGVDPEHYFSDMALCGALPYNPILDSLWKTDSKEANYADNEASIFTIIYSIVTGRAA